MPDINPREIVYTLRALRGQFSTPYHLNEKVVKHVQEEGLAKFIEWPSGHWSLTDNGVVYIQENSEPSAD